MGEASEGRSQRDLLRRFVSPEKSNVVVGDGEESEVVELSLGLSLGGRFGVDEKLIRSSSSVAGAIPPAGNPAVYRTASLPAETEEEWRKRKELQSLRRMEAKRRRSEKQRTSTPPAAGRLVPPALRGSPESRGGSSSGNSEPESKPARGSSSYDEARSLASGNLRSPKPEIGIGAIGDMPSVFTKGEGPDGRRVDGILYKYGKGEEVRIMCVCHGSFLSPADFVKHAGGREVANPLRRIVINPSTSRTMS